jgi:hypothetical protein
MAEETQSIQPGGSDADSAGGTNSTHIEPTDPQLAGADPGTATEPNGKTITIPTSAMAQLKQKEREKGRLEAFQDYNKRLGEVAQNYGAKLEHLARLHGFASWAEMEAVDPEDFKRRQGQSRTANGARPEQKPAPKPEERETVSDPARTAPDATREMSRLQRENRRLLDEKRRLNRARAHEERQRRKLKRNLAAKDAETSLRIAAAKAGVQDVDYALHLLKNEMAGKKAEELQGFDESKWFSETLRQKHPHLYAAETRPADTAPAPGGNGGAAPTPGSKSPAQGDGGGSKRLDARKITREEFQAELRKRGLTDPSAGMPT